MLSCRHSGQTYLISQSTNALISSLPLGLIYESLKFLQQPKPRKLSLMLLNLASYVANSLLYEPRYEKTGFFAYAKTKTQISFAVTAKLISAFVFATRIVQSFLLPRASSHFPWLYTARFVSDLVRNPEDRFSHNEAHIQLRYTVTKPIHCHVRPAKALVSLGTRTV